MNKKRHFLLLLRTLGILCGRVFERDLNRLMVRWHFWCLPVLVIALTSMRAVFCMDLSLKSNQAFHLKRSETKCCSRWKYSFHQSVVSEWKAPKESCFHPPLPIQEWIRSFVVLIIFREIVDDDCIPFRFFCLSSWKTSTTKLAILSKDIRRMSLIFHTHTLTTTTSNQEPSRRQTETD